MREMKSNTANDIEIPPRKVKIQDINLNLLKAFDALLTEQNVSKAAVRLGLSQPATSHALNKLRQVFNDPILVKTAQGMEPTQLSLRIQDEVHSIIKQVDLLVNKTIAFDPVASKQQFTIGIIDFADFLIMPQMVDWIIKHNSNLSIRTVSTARNSLYDKLRRNEIDIAISHIINKHIEFTQKTLSSVAIACVMSKNHPLADKKITVQNYIKYPQLAIKAWQEAYPEFDNCLAKQNLTRDIKFVVTSPLLIPDLLPGIELIATTPELVAKQLVLRNKKLIMKPLPFKEAIPTIHQIWHKRFDNDPAHKWLRERIVDCF